MRLKPPKPSKRDIAALQAELARYERMAEAYQGLLKLAERRALFMSRRARAWKDLARQYRGKWRGGF